MVRLGAQAVRVVVDLRSWTEYGTILDEAPGRGPVVAGVFGPLPGLLGLHDPDEAERWRPQMGRKPTPAGADACESTRESLDQT